MFFFYLILKSKNIERYCELKLLYFQKASFQLMSTYLKISLIIFLFFLHIYALFSVYIWMATVLTIMLTLLNVLTVKKIFLVFLCVVFIEKATFRFGMATVNWVVGWIQRPLRVWNFLIKSWVSILFIFFCEQDTLSSLLSVQFY